jgi:hypothetical protein
VFGVVETAAGGLFSKAIGELFGFSTGGYTGDGPRDRVAGAVHAGEVVFPQEAVRRYGKNTLLDMIRAAGGKPKDGGGPSAKKGNYISIPIYPGDMQRSGGISGTPTPGITVEVKEKGFGRTGGRANAQGQSSARTGISIAVYPGSENDRSTEVPDLDHPSMGTIMEMEDSFYANRAIMEVEDSYYAKRGALDRMLTPATSGRGGSSRSITGAMSTALAGMELTTRINGRDIEVVLQRTRDREHLTSR